MSARSFLSSFRQAKNAMGLYPQEHPTVVAGVLSTLKALRESMAGEGDVTFTLAEGHLYREREPLPHESLEFSDLLASLRGAGIETMTFSDPVQVNDVRLLIAYAAGIGTEPPAVGSVRLNEYPYSLEDLGIAESDSPRTRYAAAMDTLKRAMLSVGHDERIPMADATLAVERLLEVTVAQPSAALLLATLKSHDGYTFYHSVNVAILSLAMSQAIGMGPTAAKTLALGALLHDVGKARVDARLLTTAGRLGPDEWAEMRRHPQEGALAILSSAAPGQEFAAVVAFEHHARFDRTGYPLLGYARRPHPYSRLVTVADVYDALTTRRAYRRAESPTRALLTLAKGAGTEFDPSMVDLLVGMVGVHPVGAVLELDDGAIVVVTSAPNDARIEGLLVQTAAGERLDTPEPVVVEEHRVVEQLPADVADIQPSQFLDLVS
ncbi:MAG: HD domain-containing phosphohydrolase [Acidimicrobiia bacterium]